jgi:hypothetical protein
MLTTVVHPAAMHWCFAFFGSCSQPWTVGWVAHDPEALVQHLLGVHEAQPSAVPASKSAMR